MCSRSMSEVKRCYDNVVNICQSSVSHSGAPQYMIQGSKKSRTVAQASRISSRSFHANLLNERAAPGTLCANYIVIPKRKSKVTH